MTTAREAWSLGKRVAPPRFVLFLVLLPAAMFGYRALLGTRAWLDPLAMGFDVAAAVFLVSLVPLARECSVEDMRRHTRENDANRVMVLVISTLVTMVAMAAITGEIGNAAQGNPVSIVKLVGTLLLIWLFANTVYALHYAHLYYSQEKGSGKDCAGLNFPDTKTPDYLDFLYFSATLGMTFQTSDVEIAAPHLRRIVLLHSFAAFVFNIGVIAFTINTLGGAK